MVLLRSYCPVASMFRHDAQLIKFSCENFQSPLSESIGIRKAHSRAFWGVIGIKLVPPWSSSSNHSLLDSIHHYRHCCITLWGSVGCLVVCHWSSDRSVSDLKFKLTDTNNRIVRWKIAPQNVLLPRFLLYTSSDFIILILLRTCRDQDIFHSWQSDH